MATQRDPRADLSPRKVAERLKEEGKQRLERGKSTAAEQVETVASALKSAGNEFGGESSLGNYANQLADSIGKFGTRLREGSIEDLAQDMQAAARRNPALFVIGGLALGIVLARLIKAATPQESNLYEGEYNDVTSQWSGTDEGYDATSSSTAEGPTVDISGSPSSRT